MEHLHGATATATGINFTVGGALTGTTAGFSGSVIASGNSNSFGNTTIAALSASTGTFSASVTAAGNSNSFGTTTFSGQVNINSGSDLRLYRSDNATYARFNYAGGSVGLDIDDLNSDGINLQQAGVNKLRIETNGWVSVVTKPNSGLNYDVAIWVGNVLGYQTTSQLSDVLAYQPNKLSPYNGITFADGQEATNSGGTVIPAPGRNTSPDPEDYQRSFSTEFKLKSASGNPGVTGSWAGLISMAPYRPATSSFYATQIAFGGDGTGDGMFTRRGTQTTWGAWREFVIKDTSGNISPSGVYLGGTIAANRLDYYKTDTWAPQIYYQNATDQANATNSTQTGIYTKIGNVCTVQFRLIWTQASGTPAVDNIGIKNLPFGGNTTQAYAEVPCSLIGYTGGPSPRGNLTLTLPGANQTLAIFNDTNNVGNMGNAIGSGTKEIRFSFTYLTN